MAREPLAVFLYPPRTLAKLLFASLLTPPLTVECIDVQEFLGHKNISMTMRYAHLSQAHKKSAIYLLDDNFEMSSQKMDKMEQQK